jgi:cobalt-zinc-cadmium efflux system membrane fusion protein
MKISPIISSFMLVALVLGCHREATPDQSGSPEVIGETISFPANSPQLASLELAPVELRAPVSIELSGRLMWNEDVTVRVFTPFAGRVRKITADIGQTVETNGELAEVESPDFGQAQADARKAEGDLKLAERNLARLRELLAHGAAPQKDVEAAEDAQAQAGAEHARAVSKIAAYGANADSLDEIFILRSPLAGTVVDKSVSPGLEIRPDQMLANVPEITQPLFIVSDPAHLWMQIDATEVDLPHLQPGHEFTFTSRAFPSLTFTGRVDKVSEFINPNTRTIKVRGSVDNPRRLLKAEMFVNVSLPDGAASTISVPATAVFLKGDKHFVFVEEKPGQFTRQEVAIGSEEAGRVLILNGLTAGQRVVTTGCVFLQELMD